MHDLNLTLFYKTSFHVRPADAAADGVTPSDDVLWTIVLNRQQTNWRCVSRKRRNIE